MKNPFVKEDHSFLIASIAIGALTAGAFAWLYLTESGEAARKEISGKVKEGIKDVASGVISEKTKISKKTIKAAADHIIK